METVSQKLSQLLTQERDLRFGSPRPAAFFSRIAKLSIASGGHRPPGNRGSNCMCLERDRQTVAFDRLQQEQRWSVSCGAQVRP